MLEIDTAIHFLKDDLRPRRTENEMHGSPSAQQDFKQAHAIWSAACAGHRQDEIVGGHEWPHYISVRDLGTCFFLLLNARGRLAIRVGRRRWRRRIHID